MLTFADRLQAAMLTKKSVLCVGIDPQVYFIPPHIKEEMIRTYPDRDEALAAAFEVFYRPIIEALAPVVPVVKFQAAFWEKSYFACCARERLIQYARELNLVTITDGKRGDGGDTATAYAQGHIGEIEYLDGTWGQAPIRVDALTIHGYIGFDCVDKFVTEIKKHGTGAFVVDKTSFKPNSAIEQLTTERNLKVWEEMAHYVNLWGEGTEGQNGYRNLGVVMGATKPEDVPRMREILLNGIFLGPGYGGQGATADDCALLFNKDGFGAVINDSRRIGGAWQKGNYMCDPREYVGASVRTAMFARDDLNAALKRAGKYPF